MKDSCAILMCGFSFLILMAGIHDFFTTSIQLESEKTRITAYAYHTLKEEDRELYGRLLSGYENRKPYIKVWDYSLDQVEDYIDQLNNDNLGPGYLGALVSFTTNNWMYVPEYVLTSEETEKMQAALDAKAESILQELKIKGPDSDSPGKLETARRIENYIVANCTYTDYDKKGLETGVYQPVLDPYGALINNQANCLGYAKAFALLMQKSGIAAAVVSGYGSDERNAETYHAWNMVYITDHWTMFDVCWDDMGDWSSYIYFNITPEESGRSVVEFTPLDYQAGYEQAERPKSH